MEGGGSKDGKITKHFWQRLWHYEPDFPVQEDGFALILMAPFFSSLIKGLMSSIANSGRWPTKNHPPDKAVLLHLESAGLIQPQSQYSPSPHDLELASGHPLWLRIHPRHPRPPKEEGLLQVNVENMDFLTTECD